MKSDNTTVTDPAMDLIRSADPDMATAMETSEWTVYPLEPDEHGYKTLAELSGYNPFRYTELVQVLNNGAGGLTVHGEPWSILNMPVLRDAASDIGTTTLNLTASVMVHEFVHYSRQTGETEAFKG